MDKIEHLCTRKNVDVNYLERLGFLEDYCFSVLLKNPLNFELHRPFRYNKQLLKEVLSSDIKCVGRNSLYSAYIEGKPNAPKVAESIWCSKDRKKAWYDYMLLEKQPADKKCDNPIERNVQLGANFGMNGTPSMIHIDGRKGSGAMSRVKLEQWLGQM